MTRPDFTYRCPVCGLTVALDLPNATYTHPCPDAKGRRDVTLRRIDEAPA